METMLQVSPETEFDLEMFMKAPLEKDPEEISRIDRGLAELESSKLLGCEKLPRDLLKLKKIQYEYPELVLDFLSMSNQVKFRNRLIRVPRFSIYELGKFSMTISFANFDLGVMRLLVPKNFPEAMLRHYAKCFNFFTENYTGTDLDGSQKAFYFRPPFLSRKRWKTWIKYIRREVILSSEFHGLIPGTTKTKIEQARSHLATSHSSSNIYLVVETKPEEWNIEQRIVRDPLVVGIFMDHCFLIDKFETTPLEEYISMEFTV